MDDDDADSDDDDDDDDDDDGCRRVSNLMGLMVGEMRFDSVL